MRPPRLDNILNFSDRMDILIRIILAALICLGCYLILSPFLTAIIIAAILAVVTWPVYTHFLTLCRGRNTLAASFSVTTLILTVLLPSTFLMLIVAQQLPMIFNLVEKWIASGFQLPRWIGQLPMIGPWLDEQLHLLINPSELSGTIQKIIEPITAAILGTALNISNAVFQLLMVTFITFFFYRDGTFIAQRIRIIMRRVGGGLSRELSDILVNTTRSAVYGIVGTAIAQGVVAGFGFWMTHTPWVIFLSILVALFSVIPTGPIIVWLPVSIWLYSQGEIGQAVFLVIWGAVIVGSVDNLIKPLLIARGSTLPMSLIFLGVIGGVAAFGFLGLILGPVLLSIGLAMLNAWLRKPLQESLSRKEDNSLTENPPPKSNKIP